MRLGFRSLRACTDCTLRGRSFHATDRHERITGSAGGFPKKRASSFAVRYHNLYVNDASILLDSPAVNPQGTLRFLSSLHSRTLSS